jgi:hypothetical protein
VAIIRTAADSPNLLTHLGTALGSIADGDELQVEKYSQDFTGGCNVSTKDLLRFRIGPGSSSRFISASGGALTLQCNRTSTGRFINQSSADQVELVSSSTSGVIYNIENQPANASGILRVNTCDANNIYQLAGRLYQQADADFNVVNVHGGAFFSRNGSAAIGTLNNYVGTSDIERDVGTANAYGGTIRPNHTAFTPGTINLRGGTIKVLETGNWGAGNLEHGVIDLTECKSLGASAGFLFAVASGSIGPGVIIRQLRGGLLFDYSALTSVAGGPRVEYVG